MESSRETLRGSEAERASTSPRWIIGVVLGGLFCMLGHVKGSAQDATIRPDETLLLEGVREPSGLAWDERSQTLLVASDAGALVRVDDEGHVLQRQAFEEDDLEAVCLDPHSGHYLLLSERKSNVIEVDDVTLAPIGCTHLARLPRCFHRNAGFDGLCTLDASERTCVIKEKDPAALVIIDHDRPVRTVILDAPSASGVLLLKRFHEMVVVSRERGLRLLTREGRPLGPWKAVAATHVESIALIPGHGLYFAQDTIPGKLLVSRTLDSEEKLREALLP